MHAVNQMYSKHQSVGLDREKELLATKKESNIDSHMQHTQIELCFYLEQGSADIFVNQRLQRAS